MKEVHTRIRGPIVSAAMTMMLTMASGTVQAHDWYPFYCCHDKDCRPVDESAVKFTPKGWFITNTGETIPFNRAQYSPDGRFHICSYGGLPEAKTICLFTPGNGS